MIPSISAVVGGVTPERYIWRLGIALFSFPRLLDSLLYYNFLSQDVARTSLKTLNKILFVLHWIQYFSLFGLTYVSSKENYRKYFVVVVCCLLLVYLCCCSVSSQLFHWFYCGLHQSHASLPVPLQSCETPSHIQSESSLLNKDI